MLIIFIKWAGMCFLTLHPAVLASEAELIMVCL